mmetsp:Transcript_60579/g.185052  ORF Transcript_60579/g.185052 Transcript_60579/m.185052 type:complete len:204 (-) Transcript_60579:22-633(-)
MSLPLPASRMGMDASSTPMLTTNKSKMFQARSVFPELKKSMRCTKSLIINSTMKINRMMNSKAPQYGMLGMSVSQPITIAFMKIRSAIETWKTRELSTSSTRLTMVASFCSASAARPSFADWISPRSWRGGLDGLRREGLETVFSLRTSFFGRGLDWALVESALVRCDGSAEGSAVGNARYPGSELLPGSMAKAMRAIPGQVD